MGRTQWAVLLAILVGVALIPRRVVAQGPPFSGVVTDTLGIALELAEVLIRPAGDRDGGVRTERAGAGGRFAFGGLKRGRYAVTVRRIGYFPLQVELDLAGDDTRWVQFELVPRPQRLPDLEVNAEELAEPGLLLRGTVVDEARQPIEQAEIEVAGYTRRGAPTVRRTDARGRFAFPELKGGKYAVTVRRVGYAPIQASLSLKTDSARRVQFVMASWPQELPEIVVERRNTLARGIRRAQAYDGIFLTRDDIARAAPKRLGDALRRHLPNVSTHQFSLPNRGLDFDELFSAEIPEPPPAVRLLSVPTRPRLDAAEAREKFFGTDCPPVISLNGAPTRTGLAINDIDPQVIEAIEVYRRRLDERHPPPMEFREDVVMLRSCGALVVIWLKVR